LIAQIIAENLFKVATNMNGNHFLRKLIPMMPFYYNQLIFNQIFENFVELVNNKSSVCVLKVILKFVGNAEAQEVEGVSEFNKRLIDVLTVNTERIIKN